jgi:hypothetical protein
MAETNDGGGNGSGHWGQDSNGDWVWIENTAPPPPEQFGPAPPMTPIDWTDPYWTSPGGGYNNPGNPEGIAGGPWGKDWSDPYAGTSQGAGWNFMRNQYNAAGVGAGGTGPGPGGGNGNPNPGPGGGGGGGWSPPVVDPYAWMGDFGGPAIFKAYLRSAGERLQDYYTRFGGDPLKTLVNKYQEIKGMAPTAELRSMMVGALGWGNEVDPNTLEPVSVMPDSPLLQSLAKSGGNYAGLDKNRGVRYMGTRPWTDITRDFKQFAAPGAAIWPPT